METQNNQTLVNQFESSVAELKNKIDIERRCKQAVEQMYAAQSNEPDQADTCEYNIRETSKRLDFLIKEMQMIQKERLDVLGIPIEAAYKVTSSNTPTKLTIPAAKRKASRIGGLFKAFTAKSRSASDSHLAGLAKESLSDPGLPALTPFGFIRNDTSITRGKLDFLFLETTHRLEIEQRVKEGTKRMIAASPASAPSLKTKVELEAKLADCLSKIFILQRTLLHISSLYLSGQTKTLLKENAGIPVMEHKKSYTGKLTMRIFNVTGLTKKVNKAELYVALRVDNNHKARTKPSKGFWNEELVAALDGSHECEVVVYEQDAGIVGMVWFRMSDFLEDAAANIDSVPVINKAKSTDTLTETKSDEIWLSLQPGGAVRLQIQFVPETKKKKSDHTISRQKAVHKMVFKQGHKLAAINSYQVLKCAVCNDFLVSGQGLNCQLCDFTCHRRCLDDIVSKCVSRQETDDDDVNDVELKHRIPHRFVKENSMGVHWCCHCGKMLSISKNTHFTCTECGVACHENCSILVPDFCGLPVKLMSELRSFGKPSNPSHSTSDNNLAEKTKSVLSLNDEVFSKSSGNSTLTLPTGSSKQNLNESENPIPKPNYAQHIMNSNSQQFSTISSSTGKARPTSIMPDNVGQLNKKLIIQGDNARQESLFFKHGTKGVGLEDFTFMAVLGKGNFGKVMLAQEKFTHNFYAIKVLKKEFILEHDEVESTKAEKRCFQVATKANHPFLVNLHSCFQTESRLYFVMEFVSGGDLMWHIQHGKFSPAQAKFYACEVLLGLEYWHSNKVLYRDLKLDNILLTLQGHVKITDYGLCKERIGYGNYTGTFCGTPEFMAPEILAEKPYGLAADWWSFGVLIYEMILGKAPFNGDSEDKIFNAILKTQPQLPPSLSPEASDILKKLLTKDPSKRLGGGPTDATPIKEHQYFKDVNWDDVYHLRIPPPYLPSVRSPTDLSNFDEEFTNEMPVLTPVHSTLSNAHQEEFRGFTFVSEWAKASRAAVNPQNST
ncbi:kinase-like domain-containing protein [Globomyces pollinis-pini]|nr:kinase-like domain-containing protein [Globomyces pollinis-pini]